MRPTKAFSVLAMMMTSALLVVTTIAQVPFKPQSIKIKLTGTSTLHDWHMDATQGSTDAVFVLNGDKLVSLSKLTFVLPVKNLKSESNAMDKNTYKAMNTDANPNIQFVLSSATVAPAGGNNYSIKALGKLTISGTTKDTELTATGTYNPSDKTLTVSGSKSMKMTDFNVKPPTVMLGTIKTGNDITITYNLKYTR